MHYLLPVTSDPVRLIGLPYRLGANPAKHHATDCINLCRVVLDHYGIPSPEPHRSWYRRLRLGDTTVFTEQLDLWGHPVVSPTAGTIAFDGKGLAAYYEDGWLHCSTITKSVEWAPCVNSVALYCHGKSS